MGSLQLCYHLFEIDCVAGSIHLGVMVVGGEAHGVQYSRVAPGRTETPNAVPGMEPDVAACKAPALTCPISAALHWMLNPHTTFAQCPYPSGLVFGLAG